MTDYTNDVLQIVKLGKRYQLKYLSTLKLPGLEAPTTSTRNKNSYKLACNISRSITTCRNIALSNPWDYFITLTLDPKKYDRFNLDKFHEDISKFFKSINRKYQSHIDYILIPEKHSNGAWHLHGLIHNLPACLLSINVNGFLDFSLYSSNFGFCSLSKIDNEIAVSLYITKHLSKQIHNGDNRKYKQLYFCSRGLSRGELVSVKPAIKLPSWFHFQYSNEDGSYKSSFFEDDTFLKSIGLL